MISTGFPLNSGNKTELIDLENSIVKCKDLEDFPIENSQAVYANLASMPIICGGWFWINAALQYPVRYAQLLKTDSPKRWVTRNHFTTISGHFLANPFNIFHTTEALLIQNDQ